MAILGKSALIQRSKSPIWGRPAAAHKPEEDQPLVTSMSQILFEEESSTVIHENGMGKPLTPVLEEPAQLCWKRSFVSVQNKVAINTTKTSSTIFQHIENFYTGAGLSGDATVENKLVASEAYLEGPRHLMAIIEEPDKPTQNFSHIYQEKSYLKVPPDFYTSPLILTVELPIEEPVDPSQLRREESLASVQNKVAPSAMLLEIPQFAKDLYKSPLTSVLDEPAQINSRKSLDSTEQQPMSWALETPQYQKLQQKSMLGELTPWEREQVEWVATLSDTQVLQELRTIMRGHNYSWYSISQRLQTKLNKKMLKLEHFEPGNILYEWNVLCDERVSWQRYNRPSFQSLRFNRACLINLKIIPTQIGLGFEGRKFSTRNVDIMFSNINLTVDDSNGKSNQEFRGSNGYFYAEGPEFRPEYIHDRVEY